MNRLRELAPGLWVVDCRQRFAGVEVGTRMTVIGLPQRALFLHSPVALDSALRRALEEIGVPRFVVAPNRFHHLYAGEYAAVYPGLRLFVAPGLERKRPELPVAGLLGDEPQPDWAEHIDQAFVRGYPMLNEVVFLHRVSRTLVCSDLVFNVGPEAPAPTRFLLRLIGGYGRFGPSSLEKVLIRDRAAARGSLSRILAWDFDRVILAHGGILEHGGREALRLGYAWLLG